MDVTVNKTATWQNSQSKNT